jgi:hypothetical protein
MSAATGDTEATKAISGVVIFAFPVSVLFLLASVACHVYILAIG